MSSTDHYVWQEFMCRCNGFILIRLNLGLNRRIKLHCPKCKAVHERAIKNGQIVDNRSGEAQEEFTPLMSAYSEVPRTAEMKIACAKIGRDRNGVVTTEPATITQPSAELRQSWLDRFGKKLLGR